MSILTANALSQSFGAFDLFSGVSVSIPNDGKVGLVGPNGVGKTTLLLILAGEAAPSGGTVHVARGVRIGYLAQEAAETFAGHDHNVHAELLTVFAHLQAAEAELREMEAAMAHDGVDDELFERYSRLQEQFERDGGYDYELRIGQVLTGLGFDREQWTLPLDHLSGGQKTRLLLGRLLLERPDLLILDEPTNHLDVAAIEWLEGMLAQWPGAILIVSHDRYFLDRVVNAIWEMSPQGVESYRGNYSAYVHQREERWELQERQFKALQERLAKEMDYIRRNIAGQRTQQAQGKLSRLAREVELLHAGGIGVLRLLDTKGWMQAKELVGLDGRPAATVGELQQRINALRLPGRPPALNLTLPPPRRSGHNVLRTKALTVGYPGTPLFSMPDLQLYRGERAALIGPNGAGKSTLLRTLLGELEPVAGRYELGASLHIGYFSQTHEELDDSADVLGELLRHHPMPISEARHHLARFLFRGDDIYKQVSMLSGGERSRLALSLLVREKANFLLLDEPTNHLDIPAQEVLQTVLEQFEGTVLLVSHDRYLVDRLATRIWDVADGRLHDFDGTYQGYLDARRAASEEDRAALAATVNTQQASNGAGAQPLSKNERRRLAEEQASLEERIHTLEDRLKSLAEQLQAATQSQAFDTIQSVSNDYAATEKELKTLLEQWEALAHE